MEGNGPERPQAATIRVVRGRAVTAVLATAALAAGCAEDDPIGDFGSPPKPELRTTGSGTRVIAALDQFPGLRMEIQDDSLYVRVTKDAPVTTQRLEGTPLGGSCKDDGKGGVRAAPQFPVYWREQFGDWGSDLAREDDLARTSPGQRHPVLAEHVTRCQIFKARRAGKGGAPVSSADADEPVAMFSFR